MAAEPTWTVIESSDSHSESSIELVLQRGEESWEWLKQVILGEFDEDRELSAILADMTISIVPGVIIITSARDMIAIIARLSLHPERRKEVMEWVLLFGTVVPIAYPLIAAGLGVAADGVGAVVTGGAALETDGILGGIVRTICLLLLRGAEKGEKLLAEIIKFLQAHVAGNIYEFLKTVRFSDYIKPICDVVEKVIEQLLALARKASDSLWRYHPTYMILDYFEDITTKLKTFERKYYELQTQLPTKLSEAATWLQQKLDEILRIDPPASGPMLATASGGIDGYAVRAASDSEIVAAWPSNPLGVPPEVAMASRAEEDTARSASRATEDNVHSHDSRKPALESMPEKHVPCFKGNRYARNQKLTDEFDRQLKDQNAGLNELTIEEYVKNREAFLDPVKRKELERQRGAVAQKARDNYGEKLKIDEYNKLLKKGYFPEQAEEKAQAIVKEKMSDLAALHGPDLVAGGYNKIRGFGSKSVNSSLGSQWARNVRGTGMSRVQIMDEYVRTVPREKWSVTRVNMKMERCKP